MKLSAQEVATLVGGTLLAGETPVISGAAGLEEAGPGDVSFLGNPKYASLVASSKAGLVLVPENFPGTGRPLIKVRNPQLAFAKVLTVIDRERLAAFAPQHHPSAVIAATAKIGENVYIGPLVVIEEHAEIGAGAKLIANCYIGRNASVGVDALLYPNVTLREGCRVGKRTIIQPGAVIGSDGFGFVPTAEGNFKIPQIGRVEVGDDVEIGANVTIDRANTGVTRIGNGTKIDNLVQVAHNVQIGENCLIVSQVGISGSTKLGNRVTMGGQSGSGGHLTIGSNVTIAARAGVWGDIADGQVVSGFPARPHREELKLQALFHRLPELYEEVKKLLKEKNASTGKPQP